MKNKVHYRHSEITEKFENGVEKLLNKRENTPAYYY